MLCALDPSIDRFKIGEMFFNLVWDYLHSESFFVYITDSINGV
jgi:hypothetical protein